jgi:hypothetical protein
MKLSEAINVCKYSELNTLAVKDNVEAIVSFINLGLLELYGIFALNTKEHLITLVNGVTIYDLPDDFMYLTGAFEENSSSYLVGNSSALAINEENNPFSFNTVNFRQVQVPVSTAGSVIGVIYVPKPISMTASDLDVELPIPDTLVQCLLNFVAYKGHGAIKLDGQQSEGDIYYKRFKRSCSEIKSQGTAIAADDLSMDTRLSTRGFP